MPAPRIERADAAQTDLLDIWAYIAVTNAPVIADAMLARLSGAIEILAAAPLIGRKRSDFRGRPRSFPVRPFVVFYDVLPEKDGILVWRVLHGARDLRRIVRRPK